VVDESHRSIYNTFGEVLDYFKAITLGLTATPTDIIDHNTFSFSTAKTACRPLPTPSKRP
jgi:type I site-specific restriction endonuclease